MRISIYFSLILLPLLSIVRAGEFERAPHLDLSDPVALHEAVRLLEEEVKLAGRPQTYIVIDLADSAIMIKGRGIELRRLPVERWSATSLPYITATFRLLERPPVMRRKIDPTRETEQPPISLDDMPTEFTLGFSPALTVTVRSSSSALWRWLAFKGHEWWSWVKGWILTLMTGNATPTPPSLYLMVTPDNAQSFAWTVTEGMPFLVRQASSIPP